MARLLADRGEEPDGKGPEPAPPEAEGRLDLRSVLVALPGGRAGRRLGELLLEEAEARSLPLLPPEVTQVGALPERLCRPSLPLPDPVLDRAAWVAALQTLPPEELAHLLPHPPEPNDDPSWSRLAHTLRSLHREAGSGGWDFRQVAERCGEELIHDDARRWEVLSRVQDRYREILNDAGRMDREAARREALAGEPPVLDRELWLVGTVDLPPLVRRILLHARPAAPITSVVPAPEERASGFDALGSLRPEAWSRSDLPSLEGRVRVVADPSAQAEKVVATLAGLEEPRAPEEVTVGAPDPALIPFLEERLTSAGIPARHAPGRPVDRSSPFRLLSGVADYLEGRTFPAFAALIRHPAVEEALVREDGELQGLSLPVLADRYHREHLTAHLRPGELPQGGHRSGDPSPRLLVRTRELLEDGLLGELARTDRSRRLREWTPHIQSLLVTLLGQEPLDRHRPQDRETLEVADRIREIFQGMETLPRELDPPLPPHRALRMVVEHLRRGEPIPPDPREGAVEILGWLELALDDAPVLVVAGMNEPHVPEAVTADPFLPHQLRAHLGLLDNRGRFARDLLHLRLILGSREEEGAAFLLSARRDADGNPLRLSRLLLGGSPPEVARRLEEFLGEGEVGPGQAHATAPLAQDPPSAGFALPPEPTLAAPAPPDRISVTAFRLLLEDPYRYALRHILGLEPEDDRAREMDPLLFGKVAHRVLELWGRDEIRRGPDAPPPDATTIRQGLQRHLESEVRSRFGGRPHPAVRLQVAQLRARLSAFADWQAGWAAQGWRVRQAEAQPSGEGVAFPVDEQPILLRGRIDRVDHHPERGEWFLLDYKTGEATDPPEKTHRKGRGESRRWVDLQLPLYRHLARALREGDEGGGPLIPSGGAGALRMGYVALPRDREKVGLLEAEWTPEELDTADAEAREAVRTLRTNRFTFDPARTRIRKDDPLAALLGKGVLASAARDGSGNGGEP